MSVSALVLVMCGSSVTLASDAASSAILDKYFSVAGGRDAWASAHGEYVLAKVADPRFPLPATFEFCWSWDDVFRADRMRVQGMTRQTVLRAEDGWIFSRPSNAPKGVIEPLSEELMQRARSEYIGNFEVLTHRLAKRDEAISTRLGAGPWQNWVEVSVDNDVTAYILFAEDGSPKRFFRLFDETSIFFGPLADRGAVKFPAWGAFEGGEPFDLIVFELLDSAPTVPFEKPDITDSGHWSCR